MSESGRSGLRRRLEVTLVGVALVSVLLLSGLNYVFARLLIVESVEAQLSSLRDTRVQAIERGAERVETEVATLAVTPSVITALDDLSTAYGDLDREITPGQVDELAAAYDAAFAPLRDVGLEIPTESVLPASDAGRFVQYHYSLENPEPPDARDRLDDAGDGSNYSAAHARHHPLLRSLVDTIGATDLLLIDAENGEVVYSVDKRIDIGTSVVSGPWVDDGLGDVVDELAEATVGDTVISDTSFYTPARLEALVFVATAVRSGSEVLGAVVATVPVDAITQLATAGQNWELLGLGDSGDIYLVGPDGTLRTDPRSWVEDPEGYLDDYLDRTGDQEAVDRMRLVGSAALTQQVDNAAVDAAMVGDTFVGSVDNYRGDGTFAASGPLLLGDQEWLVVIEQDRSEATEGLQTLLRSTLVVMAVLLPLTAMLGWWMARSLTRPFGQLVAAADRIANGEPATGVGELGNNELGDVGRQLEVVAARLAAEEAALAAEEAQINDVLGAVIPQRLVDRVRSGEQSISDLLDTATMISFLVDGMPEATGSDQDTVVEITEQVTEAVDGLLESFGIERVRRSATNALFVAGLGGPDARIGDALGFTAALMELVAGAGEEYGHQLTVRAGLSAGDVASGVIGQHQVTFSVWGEPVSTAFTLAALAGAGEILVDADVHDALGPEWTADVRDGLQGLDDDVEAWSVRRSPQPHR